MVTDTIFMYLCISKYSRFTLRESGGGGSLGLEASNSHFLYRSPGEGNGHPLQDSCLENFTDRGPWWAPAHEIANSLTDWTTNTHPRTHGSLRNYYYWAHCTAYGIVVPQLGTEPRPLAVKAQGPSLWTEPRNGLIYKPLRCVNFWCAAKRISYACTYSHSCGYRYTRVRTGTHMYVSRFTLFSTMVCCKILNLAPCTLQWEGCRLSLLYTAVGREVLFKEHSDCVGAQNLLHSGLGHLILAVLAKQATCFSTPGSTMQALPRGLRRPLGHGR